jgi:hypothetical protein
MDVAFTAKNGMEGLPRDQNPIGTVIRNVYVSNRRKKVERKKGRQE